MAFSEICRVYQQGEKFLVLNPSVPAWIVTNINGVLLLKLYAEEKTFAEIAAMNPKIGVIFTGGEALTSSITIPAAEYAKTRGLDFQPLFPFANPKLYDALKISGKDYFDAMTRASDNVIFHEFITKIPEHYRTKKTQIKCGLGDGQISISHSGDVYPCALLHNPLFKIP